MVCGVVARRDCGLLGMGGFGIVYQAYSRETQVWLDLGSHPYFVRAHFVDELHGRLYIAMEFLPGDREQPNTVDAKRF